MIDNACIWGEATMLIFSENVGQLIYYTHTLPLVASIFLGLYVFLNKPTELLNRVLFFVSIIFAAWAYIDLVLWASPTPETVIAFWSAIVPVEMLMYLSTLYLVYIISKNGEDAPLYLKFCFSLMLIPIFLFAHTSLNVVGLSPDCDTGAFEGILIEYMYLMELVVIFTACIFTTRGYKKAQSEEHKKKMLWMCGASITFLSFFSLGNMTLLFEMGPYYEQYKLFGMPIFVAVLAYTIVRFGAFSTKAILTEVLLSALAILVFSVLLLDNMTTARPIIFLTLIALIVLGVKLSSSVKREIKQREQIEQLASGLELANDQLKVLDKMKSEFVSIASHQLRSPLTAIRGYSSMILEGSFGPVPEKAKDAVERISEASRFMASSVEDYLNVSRIQAGNMKYEYSDFNLKDLASRVADDTRQIALKKGLLLTFRSDLHKTGIVHADIGKTRQIIDNLVNNSLKYTPKGSIEVLVRDEPKAKKIFVEIKDTGIGMSQKTIENMFGKFERASNANEVNVTGTGLGLYIARKMAREMKGDVTAHSEGEGKGSLFRIELPLMM